MYHCISKLAYPQLIMRPAITRLHNPAQIACILQRWIVGPDPPYYGGQHPNKASFGHFSLEKRALVSQGHHVGVCPTGLTQVTNVTGPPCNDKLLKLRTS